jgi:hypothetical protein
MILKSYLPARPPVRQAARQALPRKQALPKEERPCGAELNYGRMTRGIKIMRRETARSVAPRSNNKESFKLRYPQIKPDIGALTLPASVTQA